ncbi:Phosphoglycerate dehydrogenase-like oxidoreductase [uncultured Alphaproteobacteria bacterium]|uniref:Phosphoglycerate dehydrogenase-like oxidoreductase n=1 Tax=uncultured Alphaproteobacteria bacterium TaxID=91750 RepID=A0A212JHM9_9PROT|nr:Phosphoglycerate dehydrogenase-like oxidoreductase [uncultured Alphaproteobacteria bacterium]
MKVLAVADPFIPPEPMRKGLSGLAAQGVSVEVREWPLPDVETLQKLNLAIEQGGPEAVPPQDELLAGAEDADILVVQFFPVSRAVLDRLPNLKLLCVLRGGVENLDVAAARARGIVILNTPGRNARAVAEYTVGLMLAETRNIARCHAALKQGVWLKDFPNGDHIPELSGRTVGFVGFGNVGRLVAKLLQGFDCDYLVYDPFVTALPERARRASLDEVMAGSDVVSIHARLVPETHHLVGAAQIALMKPTAIIVNTARSGLLDQDALVRALAERRIAGAALDVFDREPIPADDPIMALDNLTMVPHVAGSTRDAFWGSPRLCAGHIAAWLAHETEGLPRVE